MEQSWGSRRSRGLSGVRVGRCARRSRISMVEGRACFDGVSGGTCAMIGNRTLGVGAVLGACWSVCGQDDPTATWLDKRWQAKVQAAAQEAESVGVADDAMPGALVEAASVPSPVVHEAREAREELASDGFGVPVLVVREEDLGELPRDLSAWVGAAIGAGNKTWRDRFDRALGSHLEAVARAFPDEAVGADDGRVVLLEYESLELAWSVVTRWRPEVAWRWEQAVRAVNSPTIDPTFEHLCGVEAGVRTWAELEARGEVDRFVGGAYRGIARVVVSRTLDAMRDAAPGGTRVGLVGFPRSQVRVPSAREGVSSSVRALNDELAWVAAEVDVLAPSLERPPMVGVLDGMAGPIDADAAMRWYAVNLGEASRVGREHASGASLMPVVRFGPVGEGRPVIATTRENAMLQAASLAGADVDAVLVRGLGFEGDGVGGRLRLADVEGFFDGAPGDAFAAFEAIE